MKDTDRSIQEAIENNIDIQGNEVDVKIYQMLFQELNKKEPEKMLFPSSFAENVTKKIEQRSLVKEGYKEYIWKFASVLSFLLASFGYLVVTKVELSFFKAFVNVKWYIILIILLLIVIDFADKKWVKKHI